MNNRIKYTLLLASCGVLSQAYAAAALTYWINNNSGSKIDSLTISWSGAPASTYTNIGKGNHTQQVAAPGGSTFKGISSISVSSGKKKVTTSRSEGNFPLNADDVKKSFLDLNVGSDLKVRA